MAWYNPLSWGAREAEKYDPDSANARAARTIGPVRKDYDITGQQAAGSQLNTRDADQARRGQMGLSEVLGETIAGRGPSAAGMAAQGQQRAALSNAAALNAGARGRSSVASSIIGNAAASQGIQQAAQNEAIGRMQEMAQARGEQANLLGNIRTQDIGVAGQNAQLGQNAAQYNAAQRQAAEIANQAARLGISREEMAARLHQGDMEFTNLDPGSRGFFSDIMTAAGTTIGSAGGNLKTAFMAKGGVVSSNELPRYAEGVAVGGGNPSYQLMSIGQRRTPISKGDLDQGRMLAQGIIGFMGAVAAASNSPENNSTQQHANVPPITAPTMNSTVPPMSSIESDWRGIQPINGVQPLALESRPLAVHNDPSMIDDMGGIAMAKGGVVSKNTNLLPLAAMFLKNKDATKGPINGPQKAIVGEDGPEAIVDIRGIVDRPTVTTLGKNGRSQAVIPLSKERNKDRHRVLKDIVELCRSDSMKRS